MSGYTIDYYGEPLTHQKITPGNAATAFATGNTTYTEYLAAFTSGNAGLVAGNWIVGNTSTTSYCQIVSVTLTSGALTGTGAGILRVRSKNAAFAAGETLNVAGSGTGTLTADFMPDGGSYLHKGKQAIVALLTVINNTALVNIDGGKPDQTSLLGIPLPAWSSIILKDPNAIRNFKVIDYTASSASTVQATFYF
jgi:hypothetical protein